MAFCQNCGKELANGAKFCDGCGTAVGASVADGSKRSVKFMAGGEILKCPQCGEQGLSKFTKICPSCGYKFEAQAKDSYVEEIQRKLNNCDGNLKDEFTIVQHIVCPNNVQTMYEMLILASEQISSIRDDSFPYAGKGIIGYCLFPIYIFVALTTPSYSKNLKKAWLGVICSIEKKVNLMFSDTEEGKKLIQTIKAIKEDATKEVNKWSMRKKIIIGYLVVLLVITLGNVISIPFIK